MITQTVTITQNATPNIIIGRRGTYETKQVIFDVSWLRSSYGEGTATLLVKRPTDVTAYPVAATLDGTTLTWTVSDTDTSYKGHGECEIFWYVNGGLAKSCICGVTILRDIGDTTETAPDPYETWIETLTALGSETLANAKSAAQSASDANQSAEDASNSAAAALESEENALNSENAAKASEQAAALSEGNARQSANAAYQSAGLAANSATQAATSASEAQGYVSEASVQADRAEQAADNIESNVQRAEVAAQSAQNAASDANGFAGAASTKATEAAASASSASSSAVAATQKASDASASATAAASSATAANTAKAAAETAQGKAEDAQEAAETAATNAQASADDAAQSAQEAAREIIKAFPHDTASGSIANFPDGAAMPVIDCSVAVEPNQNLNGYDNPWPAGGGKNKLPNTAESGVHDQVTYTVNADGTIKASGTSNGWNGLTVGQCTLPAGTWVLSSGVTTGYTDFYLETIIGGHNYSTNVSGGRFQFTLTEETTFTVKLFTKNGSTVSNVICYPMVYASGLTSDYAPYSNICPISGWTGATVTRTGNNMIDDGYSALKTNEVTLPTGTYYLQAFITESPSKHTTKSEVYINGEWETVTTPFSADGGRISITGNEFGWLYNNAMQTIVVTSGTCTIRCNRNDAAMLTRRLSLSTEQQTEFSPYVGTTYPIPLGQTVYGGTLDVTTGKLTVTHGIVDMGTLQWNRDSGGTFYVAWPAKKDGLCDIVCSSLAFWAQPYSFSKYASYPDNIIAANSGSGSKYFYVKCTSYTTAADFKTAMTGQTIAFELEEPIVYDLTPTEVSTLLGTNNVWADTGDSTVDYYADPTLFVNKKIAAAVAAMS